jgi:hypothetical protein
LFISITVLGLVLLKLLLLTHSCPSRTPNRSLRKLLNGKYFNKRQFNIITLFNFISAKELIKDLLASKLTTISHSKTCKEKPLSNNLIN